MARTVPLGAVVVVAILVASVGVVAGYTIGRAGPSSGGAGGSSPALIAAGTLGVPFGSIASYLGNTTPGSSLPLSAQQYEGSLSVMTAVAAEPTFYSVVAAADYRLIPQSLEPGVTGWEAVFATAPEALVYDPSVSALAGINTTNWPAKLLDSGVPLGIANASTDPNGYNEIFVLELEGLLQNGSMEPLYAHYFTTPVGALAEPNPATTRVEPESNVASLIAAHTVGAFLTYRSYAVSHGLSFVDLDPRVSLGATDPADVTTYARASTTILSGSGTAVVSGAPVLFSVTVPTGAPDPSYGIDFVHVLLSPAGGAILSADGLTPIFPGWADRPASLPSLLQPDVVSLPTGLSLG